MQKHNLFFITLAAAALCSCSSPKIISNVAKSYPEPLKADSVVVFSPGQPIPKSAETLGTVAVEDNGGTSTQSKYNKALQRAKEETARIGGNGLAITRHRKPGEPSGSYYRVEGNMLHLKDMYIDPEQMALATGSSETTSPRYRVPNRILSASVGCGVMESRIHSGGYDYYTNKIGLEWRVEYERLFNGVGFGLQYSGFRAGMSDGTSINLSYFAATFVARYRLTEKWMTKFGAGAGYFHYSNKGGGLGLNIDLGMEYMVTPKIGIGASASGIISSIPVEEKTKKGGRYGADRINLTTGVRYYF